MSTTALDKAYLAAIRAAQRSKKTLGRHDEIHDIASSVWDGVYSTEQYGSAGKPAPGSEVARKYPGRSIRGTWRVRLHSSTGPVHWIVILDDDTVLTS